MEKIELTNENYHSTEARLAYMGSSQFKSFLHCEKQALAEVRGELDEKSTDALLFGSYVDAYFSNEMNEFVPKHPEMFNARTGELKSAFANAEKVIETIENDEMMLKYLSGEHQRIMTGEIAGVPFKIKIDSFFDGQCIVDQKIIKDLKPVWIEEDGRRRQVNFVEAYRYDIQGAIYQEIVRQNTSKKLPFVLAVTTKESAPAKGLYKIDQEDLDLALAEVIEKAPRFQQIKQGLIEPIGCGECEVCRKSQKVTGIRSYHELDPYNFDDEF